MAEFAGVNACELLENRKLKVDESEGESGLYSCKLNTTNAHLKPVENSATLRGEQPILLLIHGTASNTQTAFREFWSNNGPGRQVADELQRRYTGRIFAFQHRTLTESPIQNALELASLLPAGAKLHIVSHSRGGMIGELLRRSSRVRWDDVNRKWTQTTPFSTVELQRFRDLCEKQKNPDDAKRLEELNNVLQKKQFQVERFVRVCCPARGTTLASGKLDRWISRLVTTMQFAARLNPAAQIAFDTLTEFAQVFVGTRTEPDKLPGLAHQMPGSPLVQMLAETEACVDADLFVIAGRLLGDSIISHLKTEAFRQFFGADTDGVVNTGSMYSGAQIAQVEIRDQLSKSSPGKKSEAERIVTRGRYFFDSKRSVSHSDYFGTKSTAKALLDGLSRNQRTGYSRISDQLILRPDRSAAVELVKASGDAGKLNSQVADTVDGSKPVVVLLPGIMGSHLGNTGNRIWISASELLTQSLPELATVIDDKNGVVLPGNVRAEAVFQSVYGEITQFLKRNDHDVVPFEYDWRLSVLTAADRLANLLNRPGGLLDKAEQHNQPIRILAHSMGGLVTRALMTKHEKVWNRILEHPGSHTVMLGTPLLGSFDTLNVLINQTGIVGGLKNFLATGDTNGLPKLLGAFPGFLELLPRDEIQLLIHHEEFGQKNYFGDGWQSLSKCGLTPPNSVALREAAKSVKKLDVIDGHWHRDRVTFVHGKADRTPAALKLVGDEATLFWTEQGDGVVPWRQPGLNLKAFWINAIHGQMPLHSRAFAGILDLLTTGPNRSSLPRGFISAPVAGHTLSRATAAAPDDIDEKTRVYKHLGEPTTIDFLPTSHQLELLAVGGYTDETNEFGESLPAIRISVAHGDLRFARSPIAIGHYYGDPIVGTERILDGLLGGKLSDRQILGAYPGRKNTTLIELKEETCTGSTSRSIPRCGAIVLGLGQAGKLNANFLREFATRAFLDYAFYVYDRYKIEPGEKLKVSSLLIGTADENISYTESISSIVLAIIDANKKLNQLTAQSGPQPLFGALEFVELYDHGAVKAIDELVRLEARGDFENFCEIDRRLHVREGHRRQRLTRRDTEWWHRIRVATKENGEFRYVYETTRAVQPQTTQPNQPRLIQTLVEAIVQDTSSGEDFRNTANSMFQELVPNIFKTSSDTFGGLVLRLDETAATIPWEALYNRHDRDDRPFSVKVGIVRQLVSSRFRENPIDSTEMSALVVGDPRTNYVPLPGARDEALHVARQFETEGLDPTISIDEKGVQIVNKLWARNYRILHLAGHGVFEYCPPKYDVGRPATVQGLECPPGEKISGMVLGDEIFLTPAMVQKMTGGIPELVFINCCFLGKTGKTFEPAQRRNPRDDYNKFAASVAIQFVTMGVKAVVAAGWAVDDNAAKTFASVFYKNLLAGEDFGTTVTLARKEVFEKHPDSNTWAAYQCYGDPGWRLSRRKSPRSAASVTQTEFHTLEELLDELYNIRQAAHAPGEQCTAQQLRDRVSGIQKSLPPEYQQDCQLLTAIGLAWAELGVCGQAIEELESAQLFSNGHLQLEALDVLFECNFLRQARRIHGATTLQTSDWIERLETLTALIPSPERRFLMASVLRYSDLLSMQRPNATNLKKLDAHLTKAADAYFSMSKLDSADQTNTGSSHNSGHDRYSLYCYHLTTTARKLIRNDVAITEKESDETESGEEKLTRKQREEGKKILAEFKIVDDWAKSMLVSAAARDAAEPSFETAVWQGRIPLLRLMLLFICDEYYEEDAVTFFKATVTGFQCAFRRGSSPRQRDLVIEWLEWARVCSHAAGCKDHRDYALPDYLDEICAEVRQMNNGRNTNDG